VSGSWVTTIRATYDLEDVARAKEVLKVDERDTINWRGNTAIARIDYTTDSKYGTARPMVGALEDLFDPIATSEFYEPWPTALSAKTEWVES
jgi:hypothetical protein